MKISPPTTNAALTAIKVLVDKNAELSETVRELQEDLDARVAQVLQLERKARNRIDDENTPLRQLQKAISPNHIGKPIEFYLDRIRLMQVQLYRLKDDIVKMEAEQERRRLIAGTGAELQATMETA